jgi:NhaP-type Na+/H+ or K+/H+ antiporter
LASGESFFALLRLLTPRFYDIVVYQIIVSCVLGVVIGYIARRVLLYAEKHQ